ncbi:Uncharacterised protein [Mycobacteroides abscessus subsp. massiliense]|nr:Uncharacterised protein [Mycobacteroides abscessus subsp. massiliense]
MGAVTGGVHAECERARQYGHRRRRRTDLAAPATDPDRGGEHGGRGNHPPQPRHEFRLAGQHHHRPHPRPEHERCAKPSGPTCLTMAPHHGRAQANLGGDGGGQRHRVVRAEHPALTGHEIEKQPHDHQPATEGDRARTFRIGPRRLAQQHHHNDGEYQRRSQQPADLAADDRTEHASESLLRGQRIVLCQSRHGAVARMLAGDPIQTVVAERQLQKRVRRGTTDPRPRGRRP